MKVRFLLVLPFLFAGPPLGLAISPEDDAFFEKEIRPLLAEHCYQCHSKDAKQVKGGLMLDSAAHWQRGGDSGEVILSGDPENSPLMRAVGYEDRDLQMPPKYRLKDREIAALKKWISLGAPDPRQTEGVAVSRGIDLEKGREYWAFQRPEADPEAGGIDALVGRRLKENGLEPVALADRTTLIRRAFFDLTGLPPSPERVDAFLQDERPDGEAFAALVDDLLASSAYGERWGRHWLDIVRYAESMGRTRNYPFPYAWRYRDYVIDAFNADLPYNRFITEQIAGDLLPAGSEEERDRNHVATGFLALGSMDLNERDREQYRMDVVDEQIDVTGRAILALTTGCARCHDHKFDPIPQTDYYALAGIFRSSTTFSGYQNRQGGNRGGFYPELLLKLNSVSAEVVAQEDQTVDPKLQQRLKKQERDLAQVNRQLREAAKAASKRKGADGGRVKLPPAQAGVPRARVGVPPARVGLPRALKKAAQPKVPNVAKLKERQRELQRAVQKTRRALNANNNNRNKKLPKIPRTANYAMGVVEADRAEDCRVNIRGEARNLGDSVSRGFLRVLCGEGENEAGLRDPKQSGRLELAAWLASDDNPLTARVFVNRLWHHLLGSGLVRTVDNFGEMGERPSHPALLDYLAVRLVQQGWSTKSIIREIMLSETYRRQSAHDEAAAAVDPENRLMWRANVRRLQAEPLRDALLVVSGELDPERPEKGSPVMYRTFRNMRQVVQKPDPEWENRRSVYLPIMRGYVPSFLQAFDFAEPSQVMGRRDVTTVSTQALYFMNSPFLMKQARLAAGRLLAGEVAPKDRLTRAYRLCFGREPSPEEIAASRQYLNSTEESKPGERWAGLFQALFASAEFRYLR